MRTTQCVARMRTAHACMCRLGSMQTPLPAAGGPVQHTHDALLSQSPLPRAVAQSGHTPLHIAALMNHVECVRLLMQHGADVSATDEVRETAAHVCPADLVRAPEPACARNRVAQEGQTPFYMAGNDTVRDVLAAMPLEVAQLLRTVSLASYGPALCDTQTGLGIRTVSDLKYVTVADLENAGMRAWEARKLLEAAKERNS